METVDRSGSDLAELVDELDARLGRFDKKAPQRASSTGPDGIIVLPSRTLGGAPAWAVFVAIAVLFIAVGWLVLKPSSDPCAPNDDICHVAQLDIDALRVTIPDSELMAQLPDIDALDPTDVLTAGEVFELSGIGADDLTQLLSREEIDLLLRHTE